MCDVRLLSIIDKGGPGGQSAIADVVDLVLTYVPLLRKALILLHHAWEKVSDKVSE